MKARDSRVLGLLLFTLLHVTARTEDLDSFEKKIHPVDWAGARKHWAFKPPGEPALPEVKRKDWPRSRVDLFILAKLEENGLEPSPPADRRSLIRRATFDLTGLPPSPEEVDAFAGDDSPDAFERLVDRLLATPRQGERWGRYWLDVARYADTKGYVYGDREERRFVHSHVYRDWVIRAFNEDLPYDRFLLEQIAADQLGSAGSAGGGRADLAAMGFLTLGRRFLGVIHDIIDDRIDTLMRGTQALTVSCARCHDHKFDPISTRDYYSLYGVLGGSTERIVSLETERAGSGGTGGTAGANGGSSEIAKDRAAFEEELKKRKDALEARFQSKREDLTERLRSRAGDYLAAVLRVESLPSEEFYAIMGPDDVNPVIVRRWHAYLLDAGKMAHRVFAPWHALSTLASGELTARARPVIEEMRPHLNPIVAKALADAAPGSMEDVARAYGQLLASANASWREAVDVASKARAALPRTLPDPAAEEIRQILYAPESPASVPPGSISEIEWFFDEPSRVELAKLQAKIEALLIESPGAPPHAAILEDRAVQKNQRVFIRGNPAQKGEEAPRQYLELLAGPERRPFEHGSGRLELARAIASKENPLTARVMVNRIWLEHFGAGLVRTPSDFGTRSEPPTHPELLDFLALRFVESGWSVKAMHRLLMLSSTYRQSSGSVEGTPGQRVDSENRFLWRMNRSRLDFEAMRDAFLGVADELDLALGGRPVDLFKRPFPARRTVYGLIDRQFLPGTLRVFDFANPDQHSPQRHLTTVPQQALFLLNSPFVIERCRALVLRKEIAAAAEPAERIRALYRVLYQREPTPRQTEAGRKFVEAAPVDSPPPLPPAASAWRYGHGEYDPASKRMKRFTPLPYFSGTSWQGGPAWPDPVLGWVQLSAEGGHTGNDVAHAAVRRWVAPKDGAVSIRGALAHKQKEGDGVTARIVSSRTGLLGTWSLHDQKAETSIEPVEVKAGDTIDFVVDPGASLGWDDFTWAPAIRLKDEDWSAARDFGGPPPEPLSPWEEYAQALLLSNELVFVD